MDDLGDYLIILIIVVAIVVFCAWPFIKWAFQ